MSGIKKEKTKSKKRTSQKQIAIVMGVVVRNGQILMTRRYEEECPAAHLKWELPGGKIKFGEEPNITIERELFEETGVVVEAERLIPIVRTCIWDYTSGITQHTILLGYVCKFIRQEKQKSKDHHVEQFRWIQISELGKIDILPGDIDFVNEIQNINKE